MALAPARLPFAPQPISTELLSSWLLRVAAANFVELSELLQGLQCRYGHVLTSAPMDYDLPAADVQALSQFCRIAPKRIRALDLRLRVPHLNPALLLRFPDHFLMCPRCSVSRVRYAFCPLCIASQPVIHVHWEWSLACLIRCGLHRIPLLECCPDCGEPDPLTFSALDLPASRLCRSCGSDLAASTVCLDRIQDKGNIQAVGDAYRAALFGIAPDPSLLRKATDRAFRMFVEDMLEILTCNLTPSSGSKNDATFSRQDILQIIAYLVLNAAPSSDRSIGRRRYARGLVLWPTLLKMIPAYEGKAMELASRRWPVSLRQRFASALRYRTQRRWPHTPYRGTKNFCTRFKYSEVVAVYDLSAGKRSSAPKFTI